MKNKKIYIYIEKERKIESNKGKKIRRLDMKGEVKANRNNKKRGERREKGVDKI